jgi:hypothetical protein
VEAVIIVKKLITAMAKTKMPQFRSTVLRVKIRYNRDTMKRWLPKHPSRVLRNAKGRTSDAAMRDVPIKLRREEFASHMAQR